ncbi:MAG: tRNA 2-selenouridine(34) synthase MnmH [Candidatus Delongbacteria bacterium]|nr:tRNA 2-selenouridine(34) synthase MnmH [Candidatus Delongbacteria bacterium]
MNINSMKKKDRSALVEFVRNNSTDIDKLPNSFKDHFNESSINTITIDEWIELYRLNHKLITLDLRSESEFLDDKLPNAINFPILNNDERDEVGFLYKQFSPKAALFLALKYADKKEKELKNIVDNYHGNTIFVYCWRGGGRSTAGYSYLKKYGADVVKIEGGYKAYRSKIFEQLYLQSNSKIKNGLIILTGLTGCGKTEILEKISSDYPVLDIEKAAGHASSLFGHIRYELKSNSIPLSQSQFENNLFTQIISSNKSPYPFLSEGESKKISKFNIPDPFYQQMLLSPTIKINSLIELRIERIRNEYFSGNGVESVYSTVERSAFFKKLLGSKKVSELLELLNSGRYEEFIKWILVEYYDKRYAGKYKNIVAEIDNRNTDDTIEDIISIIHQFKK